MNDLDVRGSQRLANYLRALAQLSEPLGDAGGCKR